jgi:Domain of unknown function (DUF5753)
MQRLQGKPRRQRPRKSPSWLPSLTRSPTEARSWRLVNRLGLAPRQHEIAELEQSAHAVRVFQPVMVPGLLQIADYARPVMEMAYTAGPDIAAAVAVRMERQTILYHQHKQFEFVVTEGALRWRPGPPDMMRAQLDRLMSAASLPNVTLNLVPFGEPRSRSSPVRHLRAGRRSAGHGRDSLDRASAP